MKNNLLKLTLVTHQSHLPVSKYLNFVTLCAKSGLTAVQLRQKNWSFSTLLEFGQKLHEQLQPFNIPLIVNDDLILCQKLDAEGLHLGQDDGNILHTRHILGEKKIIGLSVNTLTQLEQAAHLPIDYVGIGAIFPTNNKPNIQTIWGIEGLKEASKHTTHPIIAIGGIDESNAEQVMQAGAYGIAAIDAFHRTTHPSLITKCLRNTVEKYHDRKN